ncbi:MAG: uracil-DNA glycosylase, partial [Proteobacteria bacterium]|nr:uracil-DNA glycosylase [Pseudomonadota bacterium]
MAREPRPHDLLTWYIDAGADEAIGDRPKNRFTETEDKKPAAARAAPMPPPAAGAFDIAAACRTFDELVAAIEAFDGCAPKDTATNHVIYDGNTKA